MKSLTYFRQASGVGLCLAGLWFAFPPQAGAQQGNILKAFEREVLQIVEEAKPSVVTVVGRFSTAVEETKASEGLLGIPSVKTETRPMTFVYVASGLIVDSTGQIITKSSIVDGADSIGVQLYDGRAFPASRIGSDPESGLALIRISDVSTRPAPISTTDRIREGSLVTIVGNSLGVSPSVSFGLVNGLRGDGTIQLSGHLIPGNIGSPIFDSDGHVVGIITGWVSLLDGVTGMRPEPFVTEGTIAYPITAVLSIRDEILARQGRQAWLGIEVRAPSNLSEAVVSEVEPNSPAETAGIKVGDRIVGCDNKRLNSIRELKTYVVATRPGDPLHLSLIRNGEKRDVTILVGEKADIRDGVAIEAQSAVRIMQGNAYIGRGPASQEKAQLIERRIEHLERELKALKTMLEKRP